MHASHGTLHLWSVPAIPLQGADLKEAVIHHPEPATFKQPWQLLDEKFAWNTISTNWSPDKEARDLACSASIEHSTPVTRVDQPLAEAAGRIVSAGRAAIREAPSWGLQVQRAIAVGLVRSLGYIWN